MRTLHLFFAAGLAGSLLLAPGVTRAEDNSSAGYGYGAPQQPSYSTQGLPPSQNSSGPNAQPDQGYAPPPPGYETDNPQSGDDQQGYANQAPPPDDYSQPENRTPVQSANEAPPPFPMDAYDQPPIPGDGYEWTPGYWTWQSTGWTWVPGAWVYPPYVNALWTPGYWGWCNTYWGWYPGYWGLRIGYYGGVFYGGGYFGHGFHGGYWRGGHYWNNRYAVNIGYGRNIHVYDGRRGYSGFRAVSSMPRSSRMNESVYHARSYSSTRNGMENGNRVISSTNGSFNNRGSGTTSRGFGSRNTFGSGGPNSVTRVYNQRGNNQRGYNQGNYQSFNQRSNRVNTQPVNQAFRERQAYGSNGSFRSFPSAARSYTAPNGTRGFTSTTRPYTAAPRSNGVSSFRGNSGFSSAPRSFGGGGGFRSGGGVSHGGGGGGFRGGHR